MKTIITIAATALLVAGCNNAPSADNAANANDMPGMGSTPDAGPAMTPQATGTATPVTGMATTEQRQLEAAKTSVPVDRREVVTALLRCREQARFSPTPPSERAAAMQAADAAVTADPHAVEKCQAANGNAIGRAVTTGFSQLTGAQPPQQDRSTPPPPNQPATLETNKQQ